MDTLSVANGYLYFTDNQLTFNPSQTWPGTERRVHPYVLYRARLPVANQTNVFQVGTGMYGNGTSM